MTQFALGSGRDDFEEKSKWIASGKTEKYTTLQWSTEIRMQWMTIQPERTYGSPWRKSNSPKRTDKKIDWSQSYLW